MYLHLWKHESKANKWGVGILISTEFLLLCLAQLQVSMTVSRTKVSQLSTPNAASTKAIFSLVFPINHILKQETSSQYPSSKPQNLKHMSQFWDHSIFTVSWRYQQTKLHIATMLLPLFFWKPVWLTVETSQLLLSCRGIENLDI